MAKNEVAKAKETLPVDTSGFEDFAGAGQEEAKGIDDLAVPYMSILQALSPQCKRSDGAYIEGAQEGMLYNNVTREVIDGEEGMTVIPCYYTKSKVEWNKREEGGGLVNIHSWDADIETTRDDKNRDITKDNTQIVDTRTFFVLIIDEATGLVDPAVINFTSTQAKKARQWNTIINKTKLGSGNVAPMFASKFKFTTVPEENKKGSWYGWMIERTDFLNLDNDFEKAVFESAKSLYEDAKKGAVKASMEDPNHSSDDTPTGDPETESRF